jgi:hypothetical protein
MCRVKWFFQMTCNALISVVRLAQRHAGSRRLFTYRLTSCLVAYGSATFTAKLVESYPSASRGDQLLIPAEEPPVRFKRHWSFIIGW